MEAIVSGQAGIALLVDGDHLSSLHLSAPDHPVPRRPTDYRFLFQGVTDQSFLEEVSIDQVREELFLAAEAEEALLLVLIGLDAYRSADVRREALEELGEFLSGADVAGRVESMLFAHHLAAETDLTGAMDMCSGPVTREFLQRLQTLQPIIRHVRQAWDDGARSNELLESTEDVDAFHTVAVRAGYFRDVVTSVAGNSGLGELQYRMLADSRIAAIRDHRRIVQQWFASLKPAKATGAPDQIWQPTGVAEEQPLRHHKRHLTDQEIKHEVDHQKASIIDAMKLGDDAVVKERVADLVDFQLEHGAPKYAGMSLCDLAKTAQDLGNFALQLDLTNHAVAVSQNDSWCWQQHGQALQNLGRYAQSLQAFEQAIACSRDDERDVAAYTGRAQTLKSMGRLEEALRAYKQVIQQHPEDVVAKNGRAETLRSIGRLEEALSAYEQVIQQHPEDVVAKNGRADTLRSIGRLEEALSVYEQVIQQHPEEVVAKNGRAETLRSMGRLEEALRAYEQVIQQYPEDVFARNGRGCVLADMQRWEDALAALPKAPIGVSDWIGEHIRGMIYLRKGDTGTAISIFEHGLEACPFASSKEYFRTALAAAQIRLGHYESAKQSLDQVGQDPRWMIPLNILRAHVCGRLDDHDGAVRAYEQLPQQATPTVREARDELRSLYIDRVRPKDDDARLMDLEVDCLLQAA
jgi:tetratricopeptide (TPR) repeat protein